MADYSVLLLAYGQSNADIYPASPPVSCEAFEDRRISTFADSYGFRGSLGKSQELQNVRIGRAAWVARKSPMTRNYQSFQLAAAARMLREHGDPALRRVLIRSEARGGRPIHGVQTATGDYREGILSNPDGTDSLLLLNALGAVDHAARLARRNSAPLRRVFINFLHGESDRGSDRDAYGEGLRQLIGRIESGLDHLGLPVDWLILDPAGTSSRGSGNDWPCRQAMRDVADARANVHLIGAGYAYPLDDIIHYSSESRALFGEHFGAAAAALLARDAGTDSELGWLLDAPRPPRAVITGNSVELHLDGTEDFDLIPGISDGALTVEGFSTSLASRCLVTTAVQTGPRSVRVVLDREPATHDRAALNYAFQILRPDATRTPSPLPAGRGGWRSVKALDSISLPGRRIHQWVPGFSIPFAEMERG